MGLWTLQANMQVCCSIKCQFAMKFFYSAKRKLTMKLCYRTIPCQLTKMALRSEIWVGGLCGLQGTAFQGARLTGTLAPRRCATTFILLADQGRPATVGRIRQAMHTLHNERRPSFAE
jgi:hypothetical protein